MVEMKEVIKSFVVKLLTWEAKLVLKKYNPKIIAVTGSVGKTSTKDAIYSVISKSFFARKSSKSYNSEIGIPLTILGLRTGWNNPFSWLKNFLDGLALVLMPNSYPEWLVLEVGADRPGDIKWVTEWIKPDIAVITRIPKVPVHVEFFPSPEDVLREKSYLAQALKRDGALILNGDDEDVRKFSTLTDAKTFFYGTQNADIVGGDYKVLIDGGIVKGISFTASAHGEIETIILEDAIGFQHVYPALASVAVGIYAGIPLKKVAKALNGYKTPPGRMKLIGGIKGTTIIDDTYNSSPIAVSEALNALASIETKSRKIVVLGDMLELGAFTQEAHKKVGEEVARVADKLYTVGLRSRAIAEGALNAGMSEENIFQYDDVNFAGKEIELELKQNDVVLIKGSQGVRMEKIVEEIMLEPQRKAELLVRQEEEWKGR